MLTLVILLSLLRFCASTNVLTDEQFRDIFLGRCQYHQLILQPRPSQFLHNCSEYYGKFMDIFRSRNGACLKGNYSDFAGDLQESIPVDKGLLWSGVQDLANVISNDGQRYVTLSKTLVGYIFDDIHLCENALKASKGCRESCSASGASKAFWEVASQYYAENLSGKVVVMLRAKRASTYNTSSIFSRIELKYLSKNVKELEIWPVRELSWDESVKTEKCGTGSLSKLEKIVKLTGRKFTCVDKPRLLLLTQCYLDPQICPLSSSNGMDASLGQFSYISFSFLVIRTIQLFNAAA